jgi:hypothetical protein
MPLQPTISEPQVPLYVDILPIFIHFKFTREFNRCAMMVNGIWLASDLLRNHLVRRSVSGSIVADIEFQKIRDVFQRLRARAKMNLHSGTKITLQIGKLSPDFHYFISTTKYQQSTEAAALLSGKAIVI